MNWIHLVSYVFGGAFLANAVPHLVSGTTGRSFPSPFAKPPGRGLSSAMVNVLWGWLNVLLGYVLVERVGQFAVRSARDAGAVLLGALLIGVQLAWHFGKLQGGSAPDGR